MHSELCSCQVAADFDGHRVRRPRGSDGDKLSGSHHDGFGA